MTHTEQLENKLAEAFIFFNENPKPVEIRNWIRAALLESYSLGVKEGREKVAEKLGKLYDITDKIYRENIEFLRSDTADDAANMTAILNGINEHIPFLDSPKS